MSIEFRERLKSLAKECGGNRAICAKSGVSERTFANWIAGTSEPKIFGLGSIAQTANVTLDWLVNGTPPKQRLGNRQASSEDTIEVSWVDKELKENQTCLSDALVIKGYLPFSKAFLQSAFDLNDCDNLCAFQIGGDAMTPTLVDGNIVLIDRSKAELQDGLAALAFNDTIQIKRIVKTPNGADIVSDNKGLYPTYRISNSDMKGLRVIGRVLWVGKIAL